MKSIRQIILEIISDKSGIPVMDLKDETLMGDNLDLDSLDMVEISMDLEKELGMVIPDREAEEAINTESTVLNIVEYIESKR